jgi:hypothetical protein
MEARELAGEQGIQLDRAAFLLRAARSACSDLGF